MLNTERRPEVEHPRAGPEAPAILVAYDGSAGGEDALELARIFHSVLGTRILVASVLENGPLGAHETLNAEERSAVEPLFEEARARIGVDALQTRALAGGSAAKMLIECAEAEAVGTLVLGSPHRGVIGRALLGSVAKGVMYGAPCEVVIAPRGYATRADLPYRRIGVAYDGSAEAKAALRRAEDLARASGAAIEIFTVAEPPITAGVPWGMTLPQPSEPDRLLNEAVHSVDRALAAAGQRLDGEPATTLSRACEDGVDLLVAGSRGYGPLARVLLGSVTSRLVQDAPCPVLVIPRP